MAKPQGKMTPEQVHERFNYLKAERATWENHWQELAEFILPNRDDINVTLSPGTKRNTQLLDNTAMLSNELLAGAMHGLLTNPSALWFELTTGDEELDNIDGVRQWLQKTTRKIHNVLNGSNFQTEVHQYYLDLTCFGTGPMSIEEDEEFVVRFATRHIKEVYISENSRGQIEELMRHFMWNIRQIVGEFGEEVVTKDISLKRAWEKGTSDKFEIIEAVYPRSLVDRNPGDPRRYYSQFVLANSAGKAELETKFYREFPYVVSRWTKASGESYGRSPGMNALPDAKTMNKMTETILRGAQKTVDPPLQLADDGFVLPIDTRPAGLNFYRSGSTDRIEPIFNDARIDFGFEAMRERRQRIREAFFVDQLQLGTGPQMTATEVLQRTEEKMRLLGPMLGRQQAEFLRPLVDRVFEIMQRRDMIDEAPEALDGRVLDVTYSSMIAKSQRVNEMQSIDRTMAAMNPFVAADQSVLDNFDGDKAVKFIGRGFGFPQELIRNQDEVAKIREQRQQAQQAAQEAEQTQAGIEGVAKMAPAAKTLNEIDQ